MKLAKLTEFLVTVRISCCLLLVSVQLSE